MGACLQQYTALIAAKVMKRLRFVCVPSILYRLRQTAARIDIAYFPQLSKCGNTFFVS